jgi:hypothetical protein
MKYDIWKFIFRKSIEKIEVWLKSEKNNGYSIWKPISIYGTVPLNSRIKNVSDRILQKKLLFLFNNVTAWKLGSIPEAPVLVKTFGVGVDPDFDPKIWFVADIVWRRVRDAGHSFQLRAKSKALPSYTFTFPTCHMASWGGLQKHMI